MIQILEPAGSFGSEFGRALGGGFGKGFSEVYEEGRKLKKKYAELDKENEEAKKMGIDLSGFIDPDTRKLILSEGLKGQSKSRDNADELRRNEAVIRDLEKSRGLEEGALQAYSHDPKMAEQVSRPSKESKKTQASQPIDPEQLKIIKEVRNSQEYKNADPLEKYQIMTDSGVSKENAKAEADIASQQREGSLSFQRDKELNLAQAKSDSSYYSDLQNRTKKTVLKGESLDRAEKIIKKGVSGKPIDQILENIGLVSKTSEGRRELAAEVKNQYTDFKEVAGSQLSAMEFQILSGAYPNANFSEEANLAIVKNLKIVRDTLKKEYEIAESLIKANGGKVPEYFQSRVNEKLFEYIESRNDELKSNIQKIMYDEYKVPPGKILMFVDGDTDQPLYVKPDQIEHYQGLGAEFP